MIKERYVNLEVAMLLRDKGFDIPVNYEYHYKITIPQFHRKKHNFNGIEYRNLSSEWYSVPTQAMAYDWIEKKHHYIIDVHLDVESEEASSWVWSVYERINVEGREPYARLYFEDDEPYEFGNQEFAYNDALKYVLTNLI